MKIFILFSTTILLNLAVYAVDSLHYSVQHFTDENGLPQNSIKAIAAGRSGFVWLATENGLVRFDGQSFRVFDKNNTAISSSRITLLAPDPTNDHLFALTEKDQLLLISGGEATLYGGQPYPGHINRNTKDGQHDFYYAMGLPSLYQPYIHFNTYRIMQDKDQYVSINHDRIEVFRNEQKVGEAVNPGLDCWRFFLINKQLYHINGTKLTRLHGNRLVNAGTFKGDVTTHSDWRSGKADPVLYWNYLSNNVLLALGRSLYLVQALPDGSLTTQLILPDFDLQQNNIVSIYYDELNGRIFLGSLTRGLYVLTRKHFYTLRSGDTEADEVYYAQVVFGNNQVLTPQGDVMGLHLPGKVLHALYERIRDDRTSILIDKQGQIWAKQRDHLYQFNATGTKLLWQYQFPTSISILYENPEGHLLVGNFHSPLYQVSHLDKDPVVAPIFSPISDVSFVAQETADLVWIGTGKGLYRARYSTGKIDTVEGLRDKYIRSVYVRAPGEVWITTYGDGFFLLQENRLIRLPTDKGNYLATSHCVLEDEQGYFWITTNKGLFQVARKDLLKCATNPALPLYYQYYDKHAGFNTNEFNGGCQPCGLKLPNGYISLPSINGLVWGHPASIRPELPDKAIFIDRLDLNGKRITNADTIILEEQFDFLKVDVTTPYFGNPYNVHFQYALVRDKEEPVWKKLDNDKSITLSSLPSGNYRLLIRKLNGFGSDNYRISSLSIIIPLAFYETWWFRLLVGLLIIAGLWTYTRFRFHYIRRKNKLLEVRIDERTQALQNTLNELQLSEESLRRQTHLQDRLITAITHDIKSPLKYMTMAARRMFDSADIEPDYREIQRNARMLYEAGYRMYHLTDNLLQYIKLNAQDRLIAFERVDVEGLVDDKIEIFRDIAAEQSTTLHNEMMSPFYMRSNNRLLGVVIHNLLDNAIKVTFDGNVTITSAVTEEDVRIRIEDTGVGMRPEMVNWCNSQTNPYETDPEDAKFPGHAGFGLIIVKELISLMNGKLIVTSEHEVGTRIELLFVRDMLSSR